MKNYITDNNSHLGKINKNKEELNNSSHKFRVNINKDDDIDDMNAQGHGDI